MHRSNRTNHLTILAAFLLTASATVAHGQEKKLAATDLPPAVQKTVQQETQGSTVKGFATEREHGKKVYEAETVKDGRTRDLQFAEDGTLNEVEQEVPFDELPAGVKTALKTKAGSANITKVESLTKQGKLVAYEAATLKGSKKGEVQVGPNGERLTHDE